MLPRLLRLDVCPLRVAPVPTLTSTGCEVCALSLPPTFRSTLSKALCRENAGFGVCAEQSAARHQVYLVTSGFHVAHSICQHDRIKLHTFPSPAQHELPYGTPVRHHAVSILSMGCE